MYCHRYRSDCGWVPIKLYLWTLKFEFYIIFICHKIIFSFDFKKPLRNAINILSMWAVYQGVGDALALGLLDRQLLFY